MRAIALGSQSTFTFIQRPALRQHSDPIKNHTRAGTFDRTNKLNLVLILNGLESCAHSVALRAVMVVIGVYVYRRSTSKYVRR